ncbi:MAG: hypothetical protein ACI9Y8_000001, partial [Candidatus Omnitrophota bacterium]
KMTTYTCPTCSKHLKRDMTLLLKHTGLHIHDVIKTQHPTWNEQKIKKAVSTLSGRYQVTRIN